MEVVKPKRVRKKDAAAGKPLKKQKVEKLVVADSPPTMEDPGPDDVEAVIRGGVVDLLAEALGSTANGEKIAIAIEYELRQMHRCDVGQYRSHARQLQRNLPEWSDLPSLLSHKISPSELCRLPPRELTSSAAKAEEIRARDTALHSTVREDIGNAAVCDRCGKPKTPILLANSHWGPVCETDACICCVEFDSTATAVPSNGGPLTRTNRVPTTAPRTPHTVPTKGTPSQLDALRKLEEQKRKVDAIAAMLLR